MNGHREILRNFRSLSVGTYHKELLNLVRIARYVIGIKQERTSQQTKRNNQSQEDDKEDNVGAQRANEVYEAQEAHEKEPVGYAGVESFRS